MTCEVSGDFKADRLEVEFEKFRSRFRAFLDIRELGRTDDQAKVKDTFNQFLWRLRDVCDPDIPYEFSPLLADPYSETKTYDEGAWVIVDNVYWRSKQEISAPEKWNPDHWERHDDILSYLSEAGGKSSGLTPEQQSRIRVLLNEPMSNLRECKAVISELLVILADAGGGLKPDQKEQIEQMLEDPLTSIRDCKAIIGALMRVLIEIPPNGNSAENGQ